jgi:hypothetical protein
MGGAEARPPWAGARAPPLAAADTQTSLETKKNKKRSYVQTLLKIEKLSLNNTQKEMLHTEMR